jgi:hypothetical protein
MDKEAYGPSPMETLNDCIEARKLHDEFMLRFYMLFRCILPGLPQQSIGLPKEHES